MAEQRLHHLSRPDRYRQGFRPSFYAAYARAAKRYGFEAGKYGGFAFRNNVVVKVRGMLDRSTDHEVPAESIQNGAIYLSVKTRLHTTVPEYLIGWSDSTEYVVPVSIGMPPITLMLDFDTGSSDMWVWSSEIAGALKYRQQHRVYHPHRSATARKADGTWEISYGDGSSASGDVYTDHVRVAGVHIHGQALEVAKELSSSFLSDGGNDGLLGLAWPTINTVKPRRVATPMENMIQNKLIDLASPQPVFTVKLGHGSEQSFYSFGFIDETVTRHPIVYHHITTQLGFWQVASAAWMLNGRSHNRHQDNSAILDTGTTLCLVHDDVVERIYHSIDGAQYSNHRGGWIYPNHARLPEIYFAIGHTMYRLNEVDFGYSDAGQGYTFGGIQSRGDLRYDIFGDVFLKSLYIVFDQGNKRVGVAQRDD
ncbi:acid protease [Laetiporus sulphureus 93-53]|uniref:Acid protease n=1 Tax=Laetiporus sulphureus 93-53 TaxID=1314785 RepID=A0A165E8X8_9APHY|nr:acid protease [Laetiporus sulphureus 93-53]KZT06492.1 acid protease [Laetiporus sulphureus 93-53]